MTDLPPNPGSDDTGVRPESGTTPGMPRWVKVSGIVIIGLALLAAIVLLTGLGGGDHGPGRHSGGGEAPPAGVSDVQTPSGGGEDGHAQPEGAHG